MINRFYTLNSYFKKKFGQRVQKITIDANFTCPNLDGTFGKSGCIYCNNKAFNPQLRRNKKTVIQQIKEGIEFSSKRYNINKFIAYFQPFTNTHASVKELKQKYGVIKLFPNIVGLSIGTRPDCIDHEKLKLISSYAKSYEVWIEYGLQSARDKTLNLINRGHDFSIFKKSVIDTKNTGIKVCVHVIIGLPGESKKDYLYTAKKLSELEIDGIKIHPIHLVKNTHLEDLYKKGKFHPLDIKDYIDSACDMIEYLPSRCIIHRVGASASPDLLLAPLWLKEKKDYSHDINKELKKRDSRQGSKNI